MSSLTPLRRSVRLAEKAQSIQVTQVAPIKKSKKVEPEQETNFRDLTPEEMKADFELRTTMLFICEKIRTAAKRPRTNEDFKIIEKAAEKLLKINRGIVHDNMDGFFICDIIRNSKDAKIGDENHKWTIEACDNFINSVQHRLDNPPTRTWSP